LKIYEKIYDRENQKDYLESNGSISFLLRIDTDMTERYERNMIEDI
jgi:hypothetical protein